MIYSFEGQLISEGNRSFIEIPLNVWKETGLKGNLPARVKVNDCVFECKLVPKGKGHYYIPINKSFAGTPGGLLDVSLEFIVSLTRINHDSPYSKENPIRTIDSIKVTTAKACESYEEPDSCLSGGMGAASPRKSGAGCGICKHTNTRSRTLRSILSRMRRVNIN